MRASKFRIAGVAVAIVASVIVIQHYERRRQPRIVLWAWERPENLEFIDSREIAVAFLDRTILLRADETVVKPRLQPLRFAPGTELIAVARIEADHASLSHRQLDETVLAVGQMARIENVRAIQIDYDAKESERPFYRELLQRLRRQAPAEIRLTITALASWCMYDDWLTGLPISEAVPMLFRMGVERAEIRDYIASGKDFRCALCRNSLGVSTDEPLRDMPPKNPQSVYVFNPRPWSAAAVNDVVKEWR